MSLQKQLEAAFSRDRHLFQGAIEFGVALSRFAYYQIGGPAQVLATPKSFDDLQWIAQRLAETGAPHFILGWGSNVLFPDEGFAGVVIRMKQLGTQIIVTEPGVLELGASVGGSTLLRRAGQEGWDGLAHLTGIPGSVGGMVAMNAGTHLGEFKDCALKVEIANLRGGSTTGVPALAATLAIRTLDLAPVDFSYRKNHFLNAGDLITRVWVRVVPTDPAQVQAQIDGLYQRRKSTQPVDQPSCGSVFVNPRESGLHAWQVVDRLGLRGHRVGQAQVSEKHSNFIVNLGGASARDVKSIISLIKTRARDELGIEMHEEVKLIESRVDRSGA